MPRTQTLTAHQPKIFSRHTEITPALAALIAAVKATRREVIATREAAQPAVDAANATAIRAKVSDEAWAAAGREIPAPEALLVPIGRSGDSPVRIVIIRADGSEAVTEMATHRTLDANEIDSYYADQPEKAQAARAAHQRWYSDRLAYTKGLFAQADDLIEADRLADLAREPWREARKRHTQALAILQNFNATTKANRLAQIKALMADEGLAPTKSGNIRGLDTDDDEHALIVRLMWQALNDFGSQGEPMVRSRPNLVAA